MKQTKNWIENQIKDFTKMVEGLEAKDRELRLIWMATINALYSVLKVFEKECNSLNE